MSRRALFTASFIVFVGAVVWLTSASIRMPELSFNEAAKIGDHKKRVMVATKVLKDREIKAEGASVTFYAVDKNGTESKVTYEEADNLTASMLASAAKKGAEVSIAGHVCGDGFKVSQLYLPAY